MKKGILLLTFAIALMFALAAISSVAAAPSALSARFSREATSCGILWFDKDWNDVWIEGTGYILRHQDGGYVATCKFTLDLSDPNLLSRDQFCAEDWAKFMCRGDGALVDNRTTCNIEDAEVHNGIVLAAPSGEGMFVCHVK